MDQSPNVEESPQAPALSKKDNDAERSLRELERQALEGLGGDSNRPESSQTGRPSSPTPGPAE